MANRFQVLFEELFFVNDKGEPLDLLERTGKVGYGAGAHFVLFMQVFNQGNHSAELQAELNEALTNLLAQLNKIRAGHAGSEAALIVKKELQEHLATPDKLATFLRSQSIMREKGLHLGERFSTREMARITSGYTEMLATMEREVTATKQLASDQATLKQVRAEVVQHITSLDQLVIQLQEVEKLRAAELQKKQDDAQLIAQLTAELEQQKRDHELQVQQLTDQQPAARAATPLNTTTPPPAPLLSPVPLSRTPSPLPGATGSLVGAVEANITPATNPPPAEEGSLRWDSDESINEVGRTCPPTPWPYVIAGAAVAVACLRAKLNNLIEQGV